MNLSPSLSVSLSLSSLSLLSLPFLLPSQIWREFLASNKEKMGCNSTEQSGFVVLGMEPRASHQPHWFASRLVVLYHWLMVLELSLINSKHTLLLSHALPTSHRLYVLVNVLCTSVYVPSHECVQVHIHMYGGHRSTSDSLLYAFHFNF